MIPFRIYYDEYETYDGDPYLAPGFGALLIVEADKDHGKRIVSGADYFIWDDRGEGERWWAVDFVGMIDYLGRPGTRKVLIGRMVANSVWNSIYKRALDDPDFPIKTAYSCYERHP